MPIHGDAGNQRLLLGYVKSHICFIDNPPRIKRLQSKISLAKYLEAVNNIEDDEATKKKLEEEGELAKLLPEYVQAHLSCKEGKKPGRKFTKNHINAIILICYGLRVSSNKVLMLAVLDEAVQKDPENLKAPEVTAFEADKTPAEEPFPDME